VILLDSTYIYHCSQVHITDRAKSHGRGYSDRPKQLRPITRYPEQSNKADIHFDLRLDETLSDLVSLIGHFQSINIPTPATAKKAVDTPIQIKVDWSKLARKLGVSMDRLTALMNEAKNLGLLKGLTIECDFERWMRVSREKGCLLVMAFVEESDYTRTMEVTEGTCDEVLTIRDKLTKSGYDVIKQAYIVPNAQLGDGDKAGSDMTRNMAILESVKNRLADRGLSVQINSFGYAKTLRLVINAHKLGYVFRRV
jgi:hypothetical protein